MKFQLVFVLALFYVQGTHSLNEAQLKAAAKLIRNTCRQKAKITDEPIENMHKGIWAGEPNEKCYVNCCLTMMKMVKKSGAFDLELAMKQVPSLPEPRKDVTVASMEKCADAGNDKTEKCDISYEFFKCMYFDNPENYFFP